MLFLLSLCSQIHSRSSVTERNNLPNNSTESSDQIDKKAISSNKKRKWTKVKQRRRLFKCSEFHAEEMCREHLYRIPSILVTKDDTVMAFANKRKKNLKKNSDLIRDWNHETDAVVRISEDKGRTWSEEDITIASWNCLDIHRGPVLYNKHNDTVYSFMRYCPAKRGMFTNKAQGGANASLDLKNHAIPIEYTKNRSLSDMRLDKIYKDAKCEKGKGHGDPGSKGKYVVMGDHVSYSKDNGKTWSKPKPIHLPYPDEAYGAGVANGSHGIQLSNGRFVIQARYQLNDDTKRVLFYSDKVKGLHKGKNWKHGAIISRKGNKDDGTRGKINMSTQEFTIAEHPKNTVVANFRTGQKTGTGRVEVRIENAERVVQDPHHVAFMHAPTAHSSLIRKPDGFEEYFFSTVKSKYDDKDDSESKANSRKGLLLYKIKPKNDNSWEESDPINLTSPLRPTGYSDMGIFSDGSIAVLFESGQAKARDSEWINYQFMVYKRLKVLR